MTSEASDEEVIDWADWELKGKTLFIKKVRRTLERNGFVIINDFGIKSTLPKCFYELFWQCLHGPLSPENVVETCISLADLHDEIPSLIMDTLNVFDTEMDCQEYVTSERKRLLSILEMLNEKWCRELARERLEFDTLSEFDTTIKAFHGKFIKIKTKLYYKQNKFNLYREEIEGYSKLIMQLNQSQVSLKNVKPEVILGNIRSLIGCFSLDPTRVVDIILDNFQLRPFEFFLFVPLLKNYMPEINLLSEVIGFRYLTFNDNDITPRSLHVMVCIMLHYKILTVDDVFPWLSPDDAEITAEVETTLADEKNPKKPLAPPKSKEEFEKNQKLSLCEVAASLGCWDIFEQLLVRFPPSYILDCPQIATTICKFVHYLIIPVYVQNSGFGDKIESTQLEDFDVTIVTLTQPQTVDEVLNIVFPILYTLGPSLRYDLVLLFKMTRICTSVLSKALKSSDPCQKHILHVTKLIELSLLPTLSNIQANCCVSEAVWNVVKMYPLQTRYSLYYQWRNYLINNQVLLDKRCRGKVNAMACLKRVSKENVKQIGRLLGKLSHYSPATLFNYILFLVQMFDNLIGPIVDSLKYMTNMSYDVLGFCIFDSLYNDPKQRQKHDGTTVLPWFQSTSLFCATVFKKYNIDLSGILLYVMEQLKCNRSVELLILKEILQKMTGIEITDDMTPHQIDSLSGGELLRSEAGYFVQQQNFKKTATRLKEALVENNLVAPLGIMLAQQRNYIFFSESENSHLKFVGKLYDECHDTLLQYGAFIGGPIMHDSLSSFPTLHDLLLVYKLDIDAAFYLSRPVLHSLAGESASQNKDSTSSKRQETTMVTEQFFDTIDSLSESIEALHTSKQWEDISPKFVSIFWSLSLNDIYVPLGAYQKEIAKQKEQEPSGTKSSKADGKVISMADKLSQELKEQQQYVKSVLEQLKLRKNDWFLSRSVKPTKNEMITQFLQMCIFPRSILSIADALFCAQFIHTLHTIRTGNFSTLLCYDRLFCDITFAVMSCTENEASRYGRFLCAVLQNIMRWHSKKEIYDKECANTPGFVTKFRVSNECSETNDNVHFENYRHVCHKWHYKITKSLLNLLESGEYVQIRNGLLVLIKLLPTFPVIGRLAQFIEKRINKVREEEKNSRQDLYTLATSYSGLLTSKSSTWLSESDFHVVPSATHTSNDVPREDKLDIDSDNFSSDLPSDIYLSLPSSNVNNVSSPPQSPQSTDSSNKKELSPTPVPSAKEKSSEDKTSDQYKYVLNRSASPAYDETRSDDSETLEENSSGGQTFEVISEGEDEEGELNKNRMKRSRTPKKSRSDDKDVHHKPPKRRVRSRSDRQ